jgi:hypothetical protein
MEKNPWKANGHPGSQEITSLLLNTNVQYRFHKTPPLVPILTQLNAITSWTTPWSRVFLEKLIVTQLIKIFLSIYGCRRFIIMFTRAHDWSQSWTRCIQSTLSHSESLRSISILSSHQHLGLRHGLYLQLFRPKFIYKFLIFPMCTN